MTLLNKVTLQPKLGFKASNENAITIYDNNKSSKLNQIKLYIKQRFTIIKTIVQEMKNTKRTTYRVQISGSKEPKIILLLFPWAKTTSNVRSTSLFLSNIKPASQTPF